MVMEVETTVTLTMSTRLTLCHRLKTLEKVMGEQSLKNVHKGQLIFLEYF